MMKNEVANLPLKQKIKYCAEYALLRSLAWALKEMPSHHAVAFGKGLGRTIQKLMPTRLNIARQNLLQTFPGISESELQRIMKECWENLGHGAADFVRMPQMSHQELNSLIEVHGLEHIQKSSQQGKGTLIVTAHYGAWELGAKFWPSRGFKFAVVARKVKNPYVNDFVTRIRSSHGVHVIFSRDAVRESIRWLKQGNLLAVLVDHRVNEGGLQTPFLGRPALTTSLPAVLALRYRIPVHPVHCWRENGKVIIHADPAMSFQDLPPTEIHLAEATTRINQVVEQWILKRPEAWLWIHNRWKINS